MKQPWQQQQEQLRRMQQQQEENMRRQQEELQKRQEMGDWYQQHEKKKPEIISRESVAGKFAQVKAEATKLRQDMIDGRLTKDQFKTKLRDLMFMDKNGAWWMLGAETLEWYSSRGTDWVRADPPGYTEFKTGLPDSKQGLTVNARHQQRIPAIVVLLVCLAATAVAGFGIGFITEGLSNSGSLSTAMAILVWLVGLVLSIIISRRIWRRK